ncbi:MAG: class I SAM-dependent methyltransferase [Verrucomicrobiota bacterium]
MIKNLVRTIIRLIRPYRAGDNSDYWRSRSKCEGQAAVLWTNLYYNAAYREDQRRIIDPYVSKLSSEQKILDIGCGIGVVVEMIDSLNTKVQIDACDFEEMITVAQKNSAVAQRANLIASPAESYHAGDKAYDLIISSGCLSAIRDDEKRAQAIKNCAEMVKESGGILMIDPWHSWRFLARAKCNVRSLNRIMAAHGFEIDHHSGVIFWPLRTLLSNSNCSERTTRRYYALGEKLMKLMGKRTWSDYKILYYTRCKAS